MVMAGQPPPTSAGGGDSTKGMVRGGEYPIDHDDGSSEYHDHHNVLMFGPAKQWQGHSKRFESNIQIFPNRGAGDRSRSACIDYEAGAAYAEVYSNNTCILVSV